MLDQLGDAITLSLAFDIDNLSARLSRKERSRNAKLLSEKKR